ncbi:MAG: Sulfite reductase [NADPH] flavoprotein alpha-component [Chlamydiae bacterium]|nr:Sulfite reductase [NADPH] flavoprotein alpha-component [Chlamydiota bacterium]
MEKITRQHPALAKLKKRYPLTKNESSKDTWHVTLDIRDLPIEFHPGDSVGIHAQNDPILVSHLIEAMNASPSDKIIHKRSGNEITLESFLKSRANLARITSSFLKLIHACEECPSTSQKITDLLLPENKERLRAFLSSSDPLHLLREYSKSKLPLQELCDRFGPLLPRFYSVASSRKTSEHELDLTVALFTWDQNGEKRYGVASHFLCHLAELEETPIPLFVQPAPHFRLPEDHATDLIMIGPGTGIAPFRAFLQERLHHSASGKHWLFFGERNASTDFFYREEWEQIPSLRLHTAFSRDREEKTYVQHRMLEQKKELYEWINRGAHLYVCGDAKVMAKDVHKTLIQILADMGNIAEEEAKERLKALKKAGRYLLDVY